MANNQLAAYSLTAGSNTDIAGISTAEGWLPSTVNNAVRALLSQLAGFYDDWGGALTVGGTGNAVTLTTTSSYTALAAGLRFHFIATNANSGAVTLNLDAIGAKAVRKIVGATDIALTTGDILAGVHYDIIYSTAANSAAGGWIISPTNAYMPDGTVLLPSHSFDQDTNTGMYRIGADNIGIAANGAKVVDIGTAGVAVTGAVSSTSTVAATPALVAQNNTNAQTIIAANFVSNRPTGAIADAIGVNYVLNNGSGTAKNIAVQYGIMLTATAGSEEGSFYWNVYKAGVATNMVRLTSSALEPVTNDLLQLGNGARGWSDLFLASGGVINFNNGDVTLTHSTDALAFAGAANGYSFDTLLNLSGASAGQIAFPATQNASAGANTLDDYEEGTFTPTLAFGGASTGVTYSTNSGTYTKIGNRVLYEINFVITSKGSATGAASAEGLPFTPSTRNAATIATYSGFTGLTGALVGGNAGGNTSLAIQQSAAASSPNIDNTNFSPTTRMTISGSFIV
jgi:hypothetical protein